MAQLNVKAAVITGGARGIGFSVAEELLKSGVEKLLILDIAGSLDAGRENTLKVLNPMASIFYSQCDVTDKSALEKALQQDAVQWLGSIDVLVNCAGVFAEHDVARTVAVNLSALINSTMIAFDVMGKHKSGSGGCIVNIASVAGLEPTDFCAIYSATKCGVVGFTRAMGSETNFQHTGIKVVVICPGPTNTIMMNTVDEQPCSTTYPWLKTKQESVVKPPYQEPWRSVGRRPLRTRTSSRSISSCLSPPRVCTPVSLCTVRAQLPIGLMPEGTIVCNLEKKTDDRGKLTRTSGNYASVIAHNPDTKRTRVKVPSGAKKVLPSNNPAMVGIVAGGGRIDKPIVKAGRAYHKYKAKRGGNHQHIGKASTVKQGTLPGRKVGLIVARRTGRIRGGKGVEKFKEKEKKDKIISGIFSPTLVETARGTPWVADSALPRFRSSFQAAQRRGQRSMSLVGKTAVITGGASGIGFAAAEELIKSGVEKILILDIGQSLDSRKEGALKAHNKKASIFYAQCDVTDKTVLEKRLRQDALKLLGSIDILVNSAGIFAENNPTRTVAVNFMGLIDCTLIAIDLMGKHKSGSGGAVVNISSVAGIEPADFGAVYSATKYGIVGFTRALGSKDVFERTGVKIVAICPGSTDTGLFDEFKQESFSVTFPWLKAKQMAVMDQTFLQPASAVGKGVVQLVNGAESGSVWISKDNKILAVNFVPNEHL
ncbi:uncharacterized protein LOC129752646 [Uranotaenia lowii]|uniref:uncharacterized protein LOC129752646 n=1 Tax=Uranotaenia lowii TaxID=190385 RepID=UPI002479657F|nr:uncharacterized protein LOC129752646 [Uranotaenia lowii]